MFLELVTANAQCDSVVVSNGSSNGDNGPNAHKSVTHFNSNGVMKSAYYYSRYGSQTVFTPSGKFEAVFDANNNKLEDHTYYYSNGSFQNSSRAFYTYDASNRLLTRNAESYNNAWYTSRIDSMNYNILNQLSDSTTIYGTQNGKILFFYNAAGQDTTQILQTYTTPYQWVNNKRTDKYFDGSGKLVFSVAFQWNATTWDTLSRTTYTYQNSLLDTVINEVLSPVWENQYLVYYEYSPFNQPIHVFTMQWSDTAWTYTTNEVNEVDVNGYPSYSDVEYAYYDGGGNLTWYGSGDEVYTTYDAQGHLIHEEGDPTAGGPYWIDYSYSGDVLTGYNSYSETMGGLTTYGSGSYSYADIHGETEMCTGSSTTLWTDSCAGYTYHWSSGETTPSINVSTPGSYSVTVDHGNGFVATAAVVQTTLVTSLPYMPTSSDSTHNVCSTVGFHLSVPALQDVEYQWFRNDSLLEDEQASQISKTWANCIPGNYYLVATNVCGSDTSSVTNVNPVLPQTQPQITGSGPLTFCNGDSVTLTCSNATSYLWYQGGSTTQSITVDASATYTVRAYDQYGCYLIATAQVTITQTVSPIHLTFNAGFIASGSGATYKQWFLNGDTIQFQTGANYHPLVAGWYSMAAANAYPCITYSDSIYVDPSTLNVDAGTDVYACHDSTVTIGAYSATLGGTPPFNYDWGSDPNLVNLGNGRARVSNITQDAVYYLTVTDANGIVNTDSMMIYADQPHIPTVSLQDVTGICPASSNLIVIDNAGEPYTFRHWYLNGVLQTNASAYYTINLPGVYSAEILDQHGCPVMSENDTVQAYPSRPSPVIHAILDTNVCVSGTGSLWVPYHYNNTYVWTRSLYPPVYDTIYHSAYAATYYLMETDTNGCGYGTSIQFDASQELITMDILGSTWHSLCWNDTVTLNAAVFDGWTYSWTLDGNPINQTTPEISVTLDGEYVCTAISPEGCVAQGEYQLYSYSQPAFVLTNNSGTLSATSINYMSYQWFLNGQEIPNVFTNEYTPTVSGDYRVRVFNAYGCETYSNMLYYNLCNVDIIGGIQALVCDSNCFGMLTANAYGSGTITYAWSIGANTQNISSLCPGIYWVTITDSTGCQATDTAGVYNDSLTVTTSFTNPSCASCSDGVIVASATDGVPPYTFTLIPGGIPTGLNTFSGLPAGNYQVCITDAIGCVSCTDDTLTTQVSDLITIQQGIVFPNPVRNEFVLKAFDFAKSKFVSMAIYDAAGKEAMAINSWKDRFNVEGLAPGIYSIKLLCEKEVAFFRFVKE